jgi:4a-hydroxytetrahydrobiopterin dehydratase
MTPAPVLSAVEVQQRLAPLPGWTRQGNTITKTFRFATFPDGIACIARVADIAEAQQHHPDIDIRYTAVTFTLSTHDSGGITEKDFALAGEIESCVGNCGGKGV